jgi:hypothetical protein
MKRGWWKEHTLGNRLDEGSEDKGEVVAREEAMPEGRGRESGQAGAEARLLAPRGHAQVDVVAQPLVCVDIPGLEVAAGILGKLDAPRVDVPEAIPRDLPCQWVQPLVTESRENASAFRQRPDAVVFGTRRKANHVQNK